MVERNEVGASIVHQENTDNRVAVLIAARPGRMRDSLHILLESVLGLNVVAHADDCGAAVRMVAEQRPALVLLDTDLPGAGVRAVLAHLAANGSQSRCLALADSPQARREAQAAGANRALLKGFPAAELFEAVEELLAEGEARREGRGADRTAPGPETERAGPTVDDRGRPCRGKEAV